MSKFNTLKDEIKSGFSNESTGHDWYHVQRVLNNAIEIHKSEGGSLALIKLAALMHDVGDHKFHNEENAPDTLITEKMMRHRFEPALIQSVLKIVKQVSYKGAGVSTEASNLEAKIVQDADRLDALGAIGIARAFAFGGNRNREIYNPDVKPSLHHDFKSYKSDKGHTINHFYEKLLLLKDRMQTETGKKMAKQRHDFMEKFLDQFYKEWG